MKILLAEQELQAGVRRLAAQIRQQYGEQPLTLVAVMTGSVVLLADLMRLLDMPLRIGVIGASSYRGGTTAGELQVASEMLIDIRDRDVLLVDDIFDTGRTLERLVAHIGGLGARSVRTAVLLHKQRETEVTLRPDFVAFEIPDEFVVGYGLDYRDHYRNLPFLGVLEPQDLERDSPAVLSARSEPGDG
ncbi:hypoxanthine phosphoribosyltransferase [Candidatus Laterigemmans baculatus]|uniref:hypoxanthine phosphoribosyltransferase n=1 Tax=Candidatus Laterigemmans baculatus TaxID=2770505 RepID=UPI0013DCD67A|nr:hypoxanthine phosphoribosyltransferase [Candidatus Laterigemmans baculatus]